MKIAVLIPAFNEVRSIRHAIWSQIARLVTGG